MRKFLVVVVLISCALIFAGCGTVTYSCIIANDGVVTYQLTSKLDMGALSAVGVDTTVEINILKNKILEYGEDYKNQVESEYNSKVLALGLASEEESNYLNQYFSCEHGFSDSDTNLYVFNMKYASSEVYDRVYGDNDDEEDDYTVVRKSIFMDKIVYSQQTVFASPIMGVPFGDFIILKTKEYLKESYPSSLVDAMPNPKFEFCYVTPSPKVGTNAPSRDLLDDGRYSYTWTLSSSEAYIELYQYSPRRWVWYTFAFVVALVVSLGCVVIEKVKKNNKKKTTIESKMN